MKLKLFIFILFILTGVLFSEAQVLSRDSLYNEFRHFIRLLDETHPDPYSEYGGKVSFHKEAFEIEQILKSDNCTLDQYQNILASFVSGIHDGHTFIRRSSKLDAMRYVSLMLKPIPDGMIVAGLPAIDDKYLGSRLISVNGTTLDSLCKNISRISPNENKYGEYIALARAFSNPVLLVQLFPDIESKESLKMVVETPEDEIREIAVRITDNKEWSKTNFSQLPKGSKLLKDKYLFYDLLDGNQIMYLRLKSVMARENFLAMQQQKNPSLNDQLKSFYQWVLQKTMPANVDDAIAQLPCFSELFRDMLSEMKRNKTRNLILDLRGNAGGWTPIVLPTLYMMYGDKYLDKDMETNYYKMFSPLYMKKNATTLEDFNKNNNSDYWYGDYSFRKPSDKTLTQVEKRERFLKSAIGDGASYIKDLDGKPIYTPEKIYILTDAGTFSAAFHYAFYLWKMGAVVAGVPSAQATNTFMETTEFELPYSKTKGSISNSVQYYLPSTDKRAKIFWPDMMPEYKDYKKYNFDQDAELLWLLDRINNK